MNSLIKYYNKTELKTSCESPSGTRAIMLIKLSIIFNSVIFICIQQSFVLNTQSLFRYIIPELI